MRSAKTKLLQTIICLWKNARKHNNCSNISHRKKYQKSNSVFTCFSFIFVGFLSKAKFGKTAVILGLVKHALSKVVERKFHTF